MKLKLNELDVVDNYGNKTCCILGKTDLDTTENYMWENTKNFHLKTNLLNSDNYSAYNHALQWLYLWNSLKI